MTGSSPSASVHALRAETEHSTAPSLVSMQSSRVHCHPTTSYQANWLSRVKARPQGLASLDSTTAGSRCDTAVSRSPSTTATQKAVAWSTGVVAICGPRLAMNNTIAVTIANVTNAGTSHGARRGDTCSFSVFNSVMPLLLSNRSSRCPGSRGSTGSSRSRDGTGFALANMATTWSSVITSHLLSEQRGVGDLQSACGIRRRGSDGRGRRVA